MHLEKKIDVYKLDKEAKISSYSFTVALSFPVIIGIFSSYLSSDDVITQVYYDNLILISYIIFCLPLLFRLLSIFFRFYKTETAIKMLNKRQKRSLESYKQIKNDVDNSDIVGKISDTIYFTSVNNIMWSYYIFVIIYILFTIFLYFLFDISSNIFNLVPSILVVGTYYYKQFKK